MAVISVILKAVDQYSSTITGLNQGFDLLSKGAGAMKSAFDLAFGALKTSADLAFKGISEAGRLASLGGAFDEQRNQFENLAKSYGQTGQKIIDTVKAVSSNTLTELESIPIATRGLAAGLTGPEFETALAYTKKWSEATGQNFASLSEQVFNAFQTGKFSILKTMDLTVEKGEKVSDILAQMGTNLKRFGATGFNTADQLQAINASWTDFVTKIGQSINQSVGWQSILTKLTDSVISFSKSFNVASAREFFGFVGTVFDVFYDNFDKTIKQIVPDWETFWYNLKTITADAINFIAKSINSIVDLFKSLTSVSDLADIFVFFANAIVKATELAAKAFVFFYKNISENVNQLLFITTKAAGALLQVAAIVSERLFNIDIRNNLQYSIDFLIESSNSFKKNLDEIPAKADNMYLSIDNASEIISQKLNKIAEFGKNINFDVNFELKYAQFESQYAKIIFEIDRFNNTYKLMPQVDATTARDNLLNMINDFKNTWGNARKLDEVIIPKVQPELDFDTLKQTIQAASEQSIITPTIQFNPEDVQGLQQSLQQVLTAAMGAAGGFGITPEMGLSSMLGAALTPREQMRADLAKVDWPSEFRAMGEFLMSWILAKSSGEDIPMAVTTQTGGDML